MFDPGIKILIVDDMRTMRKIAMKSCKALGYSNFVEAADGQEAWQVLSDNVDVGLIISDWNMPNCSGLDFLKRVRGDSRFVTLSFLMVTAENEVSQVREAVAAGVSNYLVKPFDPESLRAKIEACYQKVAA